MGRLVDARLVHCNPPSGLVVVPLVLDNRPVRVFVGSLPLGPHEFPILGFHPFLIPRLVRPSEAVKLKIWRGRPVITIRLVIPYAGEHILDDPLKGLHKVVVVDEALVSRVVLLRPIIQFDAHPISSQSQKASLLPDFNLLTTRLEEDS